MTEACIIFLMLLPAYVCTAEIPFSPLLSDFRYVRYCEYSWNLHFHRLKNNVNLVLLLYVNAGLYIYRSYLLQKLQIQQKRKKFLEDHMIEVSVGSIS